MITMVKIIPPLRTTDQQGSGAYGAPRSGGRKHRGVDIACHRGSVVLSVKAGKVTKIGYPYSPEDKTKGHLRYVELTDVAGYRLRYFYVHPVVTLGDVILTDEKIGTTQGLTDIYPGITDHFHFEVIFNGEYLDPLLYLQKLERVTG